MHTMRHRTRRSTFGVPALVLALAGLFTLIVACDGTPTTPTGEGARIQVLLTDYPLEAIEAAEVKISRVYLVGGGQGQLDLFNDPDEPHELDLLDLQDGVSVDLTGEVVVPEGRYGQLRFVVDEAHIFLAEGYVFADGSSDMALQVPSQSIMVNLGGTSVGDTDLVLEDAETTVVLVDFDVEQSFVFQGPPESPHGVLFTPVLHELSRSTDGEDDDDDDGQ